MVKSQECQKNKDCGGNLIYFKNVNTNASRNSFEKAIITMDICMNLEVIFLFKMYKIVHFKKIMEIYLFLFLLT